MDSNCDPTVLFRRRRPYKMTPVTVPTRAKPPMIPTTIAPTSLGCCSNGKLLVSKFGPTVSGGTMRLGWSTVIIHVSNHLYWQGSSKKSNLTLIFDFLSSSNVESSVWPGRCYVMPLLEHLQGKMFTLTVLSRPKRYSKENRRILQTNGYENSAGREVPSKDDTSQFYTIDTLTLYFIKIPIWKTVTCA